jgi:hypothetical protein
MISRCTIVIAILLAFRPAAAETLNADAARRFVVGQLFAFNCFDGSRGAGRIYGDGSVVGTIQFQGVGPVEWVSLPSGTLKIKGEAVCASLNRLPIEPCFNLNRIDDQSFRGSISGLDFAYCDFSRREGYRSKAASGAALAQAYGVVTGELRKGAGLCAGWRLLSSAQVVARLEPANFLSCG